MYTRDYVKWKLMNVKEGFKTLRKATVENKENYNMSEWKEMELNCNNFLDQLETVLISAVHHGLITEIEIDRLFNKLAKLKNEIESYQSAF